MWARARQNKQNGQCTQEKTQISLGICLVWSESSLCAWRNIGSLPIPRAHKGDWSDAHADPSLCWVHRSFSWFCHAAAHVMNVIPMGDFFIQKDEYFSTICIGLSLTIESVIIDLHYLSVFLSSLFMIKIYFSFNRHSSVYLLQR